MLINLKVKTLDAQTHEFSEINNEITVRDFKDQIAEKTGISPDQQRIIYCGRVLADEKHLKDYDVDGKVLHVAERPPPLQRTGSASSSAASTDNGSSRERPSHHNMRNSPLFRALDGMVVGTMAIPMNGGNMHNGAAALHPLTASSSFCMNRITVARHMLNCANNIAAYLEDPTRGLNNVPLDILARGRWTMESTVVEVGITATDLPQSQNIVEMVQGAVSAALRRNGNTNVTVVQLPTMFSSNDGDALAAGGDLATAGTLDISDSNASLGERGIDSVADHHAAVIIEDIIQDMEDAATNASSNVAQAGSAASSDSGSSSGGGRSNSNSNLTNTTDGGIGSTSVGTNTDDNIQSRRTGTNVLAEVFEQMRNVWARLAPFIEQTQDMLQNEPSFDEQPNIDGRENAQRLFDRVSEAFHYLSHAQHAISDLMLDFGQPTPRYLTCRPILVEQSGYVSSNNYMSAAAAAAAAANAFRQSQNNTQQQQQQQPASLSANMTQGTNTQEATTQAEPETASTTITAASNSNSNSSANNIEDDPIDDLISAAAARGSTNPTTTTSNAGTQSNDNHQLQMARLIQAVVNSAPADTEFHVQINAPSIVSFGVPMGAVAAAHGSTNRNDRSTTALASGTNSSGIESSTTLGDIQPTTTTTPAAETTTASSPSPTPTPTPAVTTASSSASSSVAPAVNSSSAGVGTMGNQVRVNTATLPTTSTQTRSTSRPQVQIGNLPTNNIGTGNSGRLVAPQMSAFDRFLPCNSHHIREANEIIHNENGTNSNPPNPAPSRGFTASFLNQANAANRATSRILTDLIRRPALTVGSTMGSPRASAAPYSRRPTNSQSSSNASPSATTGNVAAAASAAAAADSASSTGTSTTSDDQSRIALSSFWENPCTNILRDQFIEFFTETLFDGLPMYEANMDRARNRAINWFAEHLFYLRQYENPAYDCRNSILNILRNMWPLFIEAFMDRQIGAEQYESRVKLMCKQFVTRLYSVLIVCIGRENADLFWGQLMRHLAAPIKLRFRTEACQFLLCFITSEIPENTDVDDAGQFITHRETDGEMQEANKSTTKESESMESDQLQAANSASDIPPFDTEMLEIASTSSLSNQSDLTTMTNSLDSALSSVVELPKVDMGTESWHNAFPSSWLPLLTRDVQFQAQHPPSQPPFSDGYISAKRRKTNQSNKAPTDFKGLIASSVRESLQSVLPANPTSSTSSSSSSSGSNPTGTATAAAAAAATNNLTDPDVLNTSVKAISEDAAVQTACKDAARTQIRQRLKEDEDYEPERFPLTTKFVEKK